MNESLTVGIQFFPENQANTLDMDFPDRFQLGSRETVLVEDVLAAIFGYDTNIKGLFLVTVDSNLISGNSDEANIAGITRTYNVADPAGTYGQSVDWTSFLSRPRHWWPPAPATTTRTGPTSVSSA